MYEKSQATITQILDAAQQSFVDYNYNDITMTAIAREARLTKGAIYHHFESKEDLFLKMMARYLDRLQTRLRQAVDSPASAFERLAQLTTLYLELPAEEQQVIRLVRRDANRFASASRQKLVNSYQQALPNQIQTIIADGIAAGEIINDDARLLAWQYVAIVEVYLSDYARQQFDEPKAMAIHLTSLFFNGVACSGKIEIQSIESKGKKNGANVH